VDKPATVALIVFFVAVMLGAMALSWWARKKRQSGYAQLAAPPSDLGAELGEFEGLYLATTPAGEPLDRIAVRGLGFRARTTLRITAAGLVFIGDRFIPVENLREVGRASWTIDRGVEPEGLSVVSWTLGEAVLDSYFRLDDPEGFLEAAGALIEMGKK
jgi:hypothetical protein